MLPVLATRCHVTVIDSLKVMEHRMTLNRVVQPQVAGGGWAPVVVREHGTPSFLRGFPAALWQTAGIFWI